MTDGRKYTGYHENGPYFSWNPGWFSFFLIFVMSKSLNNKVLDDLNWHILEELQTDGRMPAVEIGRRIGLSAPAVADRIQKLEDLGYIKGYQTLLDLDKLGLTIRAMVSYKNTRLKHSDLIRMIGSIPEVLEWYTVTGNYSVLLKLATSSSQRLAALIVQLEEFGETNTSLILEQNQDRKIVSCPSDPSASTISAPA
jgi:Lrp/AsnC family leucine-responsive transcriptional regulator